MKIEDFINHWLSKLWELISFIFLKLTPPPVRKGITSSISWLKQSPQKIKRLPSYVKEKFKAKDQLKSHLQEFIAKAKHLAKEQAQAKGLKNYFLKLKIPYQIIYDKLQTVTPTQFLFLFLGTLGAFMAGVGIYYQGGKIINTQFRGPASVDEEIPYQRPVYYKLPTRELSFNAFKIPLHFSSINEIRSVTVDFSMIASNRFTRNYLAKHEFELRNHLIMNFEQIDGTFAMSAEGQEVVRLKFEEEVNYFLRENNINGTVSDVRIIYNLYH
jgi:flagellar basal body-associated protein FliL